MSSCCCFQKIIRYYVCITLYIFFLLFLPHKLSRDQYEVIYCVLCLQMYAAERARNVYYHVLEITCTLVAFTTHIRVTLYYYYFLMTFACNK